MHFVGALWKTQIAFDPKRQGERLPNIRRLIGSPLFCVDLFHRERAVGKDDLELLIKAGCKFFALDFGEVEHLGKVTCDV